MRMSSERPSVAPRTNGPVRKMAELSNALPISRITSASQLVWIVLSCPLMLTSFRSTPRTSIHAGYPNLNGQRFASKSIFRRRAMANSDEVLFIRAFQLNVDLDLKFILSSLLIQCTAEHI
jgi:hypothetical protein